MEDHAQDIPAQLIDPAPVLLRPVNKLSQVYLNMVADFAEDNMFGNSILVRPLIGGRYEVVDGMWRWTAGHEAGMQTFQCIVKDMPDIDVLIWQIKCNATRQDTDLIEYAKHLQRLMDLDGKTKSLKELAELTGRSRSWVCEMLSLNNIRSEYKKLVTRGEIPIGNARQLAKLKTYLQPQYVEAAKKETQAKFKLIVAAAINEFRESLKAGNVEAFWKDEVRPYSRKIAEINAELQTFSTGAKMIAKYGCVSPLEGWKLAVQWLMNMDPEMLAFRKDKMKRIELEKLAEQERLASIQEARKKQAFGGNTDP